jgi:hypothetical protein
VLFRSKKVSSRDDGYFYLDDEKVTDFEWLLEQITIEKETLREYMRKLKK